MPAALRLPNARDYFVLCLCAALLASSFSAITIALKGLEPLHLATGRCVIASLALWLWSKRSFRRHNPPTPIATAWPALIAVGLFGYALPFSLLAWAETALGPGHTAMLFCSGPIFAVLIAWLWQKDEKSSSWIFGAMALCTLGIALMVLPADMLVIPGPTSSWAPVPQRVLAALTVLACALSYAMSGVWTRKAQIPSEELTRKSLVCASIMLLVLCFILPSPQLMAPPRTWWACLYLGLVPTALCSLLRYQQIQELGYTFVSQTGYLVPTLGTVIGMVFFQESLAWLQLAGLGLSLLGLAWANLLQKRRNS